MALSPRGLFRLILLASLALILTGAGLIADPWLPAAAAEEWEEIQEGISYRMWVLPDPNRVYVARMDRSNDSLTLDTMIAQGQLASGTETVSAMAQRYEGAVNSWQGPARGLSDVVVAINGSFFNLQTGVPETGMVQSGWYVKKFDDLGDRVGFVWKYDRSAFIGQCTVHQPEKQVITFLDSGEQQAIDWINIPRFDLHQLILYTPQYAERTGTDGEGVEVLVEMRKPVGLGGRSDMATGIIRDIQDWYGNNQIPAGHVVLYAHGNARKEILRHIEIGDEIGLSFEIDHLNGDCSGSHPEKWAGTYASLGGSFDFLLDGEIHPFLDDAGAAQRNPRTAICYNDQYVYFLVVDGRAPGYSEGMTIQELGIFCRDTLGADWGINQDGGGSSAMWVEGRVVNRPSDGAERPVSNGWMMVHSQPVRKSSAFTPGNLVRTYRFIELRLGPDTNDAVVQGIPEGDSGRILQPLNEMEGIFAKGAYWWYIEFGNQRGWIPQSAIELPRTWFGWLHQGR